jgi:hypothetical protein
MDLNNLLNEVVFDLAKLTADILNNKQELLRNIKWTDGESNTDTEFSQLSCECCEEAWSIIKDQRDELSDNQLSVSIPDIVCEFVVNDEKITKHIELKSSKRKLMCGSTIGKLDVNQPMIFCLRPKSPDDGVYYIKCSQYFSAMNLKLCDLFVDRTPRPYISFDKMKVDEPYVYRENLHWIEHYAQSALTRIKSKSIKNPSWQDELVKCIRKAVIEDYTSQTTSVQN